MNIARRHWPLFLLCLFGEIGFTHAAIFPEESVLEIFAFHKREDITCEALFEADQSVFKDAKPFAREKASTTNNGGAAFFALEHLIANLDIVIFVRVVNPITNIAYAAACEENILTKAGERKELQLLLKPLPIAP